MKFKTKIIDDEQTAVAIIFENKAELKVFNDLIGKNHSNRTNLNSYDMLKTLREIELNW